MQCSGRNFSAELLLYTPPRTSTTTSMPHCTSPTRRFRVTQNRNCASEHRASCGCASKASPRQSRAMLTSPAIVRASQRAPIPPIPDHATPAHLPSRRGSAYPRASAHSTKVQEPPPPPMTACGGRYAGWRAAPQGAPPSKPTRTRAISVTRAASPSGPSLSDRRGPCRRRSRGHPWGGAAGRGWRRARRACACAPPR